MSSREPEPTAQATETLLAHFLTAKQAQRIAAEFPIRWLADARRGELRIGEAAYHRLMAAIELGRRVVEPGSEGKPSRRIASSTDAIAYCRDVFDRIIREAKQEQFHVVTMTTKNKPIGAHLVTQGTLDSSLVHPREVFRPATRDAAASVLLAHNHPSGDPTPSKQDLEVTERLEEAGKLLGIDVLDHIVMARQGCISIMEHRKTT